MELDNAMNGSREESSLSLFGVESLDESLLPLILKHLTVKHMANIFLVNSIWNRHAKRDVLWRHFVERDFDEIVPPTEQPSWLEYYQYLKTYLVWDRCKFSHLSYNIVGLSTIFTWITLVTPFVERGGTPLTSAMWLQAGGSLLVVIGNWFWTS